MSDAVVRDRVGPSRSGRTPISFRFTGSPAMVVGALVAGLYFAAAKLGLKVAFVHPNATAVWPPTGLALAAVLVFGPRIWPAIALGAFAANLTTAGSLASSAGIAIGNTLEALVGGLLVRRFAGGPGALSRPRDIFKFVALAAGLSTMVSATIGVTSLALAGYARWSDYGAIWTTWWLGDAMGDLVVAPPLLLWLTGGVPRVPRERILEVAGLSITAFVIGLVYFGGIGVKNAPIAYLWLPLFVWIALRFGPRAVATAVLALSAVAVWATTRDIGPFALPSPNASMLFLQAYMGVLSVVAITLAASVSERDRVSEELRRTRDELELRVQERTADLTRTVEAMHEEIRERLRTEERLRERERDLAGAQTVAHIGSWSWDIRTGQVAWSDELFRIHGIEPQSVTITYESFLELIHPEDRTMVEQMIQRSYRTGEPFSFEHRIVRADGNARWLHGLGEVQTGPESPTRMYGTARDITERKLAELDRSRLEKEMLELSEQERQRVGRDLHDDLGQILTGISFLSKSVETKLAARSFPERALLTEICGLAQEAIAKARNLSRGLAPVTLEPGGFVAAIQELAAVTQRLFEVKCVFECREPVALDSSLVATHLYRIAQEALMNAVRHGQGREVVITLANENDLLNLAVKDDGIGIGPGAEEGEGLGLRIMKYRATLMGGTLEIVSGPAGTTVACSVPGVARAAGDHALEEVPERVPHP